MFKSVGCQSGSGGKKLLLNGGHIMENISGLEFSYRFYSHQLCLLVIVCYSMVVLTSRKKEMKLMCRIPIAVE